MEKKIIDLSIKKISLKKDKEIGYVPVHTFKELLDIPDANVETVYVHTFQYTKNKKTPIKITREFGFSKGEVKPSAGIRAVPIGDDMEKTLKKEIVVGAKEGIPNYKMRIGRYILSVEFSKKPDLLSKQLVYEKFLSIMDRQYDGVITQIDNSYWDLATMEETLMQDKATAELLQKLINERKTKDRILETVTGFIKANKDYLDVEKGQINLIFQEPCESEQLCSRTFTFHLDRSNNEMIIKPSKYKKLPENLKISDKVFVEKNMLILSGVTAELYFKSPSFNNLTMDGPNFIDTFITNFRSNMQNLIEAEFAKEQANRLSELGELLEDKNLIEVLNIAAIKLKNNFNYKEVKVHFKNKKLFRYFKEIFKEQKLMEFTLLKEAMSEDERKASNYRELILKAASKKGQRRSQDIIIYTAPDQALAPQKENNLQEFKKTINKYVRDNILYILSSIDLRTSLYNADFYEDTLEDFYKAHEDYKVNIGLFFMDMNNLKPWNEMVGHAAGNKFLARIAQTILAEIKKICRAHANDQDAIGVRYGGDEFIMLAREVTREDMLKIAKNVFNDILKHPLHAKLNIKIQEELSDSSFDIDLIDLFFNLMNPDIAAKEEDRKELTISSGPKGKLPKRITLFKNYINIVKKNKTDALLFIKEILNPIFKKKLEKENDIISYLNKLFQSTSKDPELIQAKATIKSYVTTTVREYMKKNISLLNIHTEEAEQLDQAINIFLQEQYLNTDTDELKVKMIKALGADSMEAIIKISTSMGIGSSDEDALRARENFFKACDGRNGMSKRASKAGEKCIVGFGDRIVYSIK